MSSRHSVQPAPDISVVPGPQPKQTKRPCDTDQGSECESTVDISGKWRLSGQHFDCRFHPEVEKRLLKHCAEESTRPEVIIAVAVRHYLAMEDGHGFGDDDVN